VSGADDAALLLLAVAAAPFLSF